MTQLNTYKIYWREYMNNSKTGDNLMRAESEEQARKQFELAYPINVITNVVNCSTVEYQAARDLEQFDCNERRRF